MAAVALLSPQTLPLTLTAERAELHFQRTLRTESTTTVPRTDNASSTSSASTLRELRELDVESDDFGLKLGSILQSQQHYEEFASGLADNDRKALIEFLDKALDSRTLKDDPDWYRRGLRAPREMCGTIADLPDSHLVDDTLLSQEDTLLGGGGSADIYLGKYKDTRVAVKRFRIYESDDLKVAYRAFCYEVVVWKRFSHPNILPFLGVSKAQKRFYTLSECMNNGNVNQYLRKHPETNRLELLLGIAKGLEYLHDRSVIHGDLKGANIVVDAKGNPLLTDFGLSSIMVGPTSIVSTSLEKGGGTARWMAPELSDPEDQNNQVVSTCEADIFSFAMVVIEVFTGALPFSHIQRPEKVVQMVTGGDRPERPGNAEVRGLTDDVWGIVQKCWVKEPGLRLRAFKVVEGLETAVTAFVWSPECSEVNELSSNTSSNQGVFVAEPPSRRDSDANLHGPDIVVVLSEKPSMLFNTKLSTAKGSASSLEGKPGSRHLTSAPSSNSQSTDRSNLYNTVQGSSSLKPGLLGAKNMSPSINRAPIRTSSHVAQANQDPETPQSRCRPPSGSRCVIQ